MKRARLTEKLALQVDSFQESFDILSGAGNLHEMVKSFVHILRGTFLVPGVSAYHEYNGKGEWIMTAGDGAKERELVKVIGLTEGRDVKIYEEGEIGVTAVQPLSGDAALVFFLRKKMDGSGFTAMDIITLQILLQIFDSAYRAVQKQKTEKELIFALNDKIAQLNNLIDTVIEISRYDNRHIMYDLILQRISSLTDASAALCRVTKSGSKPLVTVFPPGTGEEYITGHIHTQLSSFTHKDILYEFIIAGKETRSGTTAFSELDIMLLDALARQAQSAVENQYLNLEAIEKEKIEQELGVAASIQKKILPEVLPEIPGYDIAGTVIPSRNVGGDYYDVIKVNEETYALIVADVAGKGIGAALLVSTLHAALISHLAFDLNPADIAARLNTIIYRASPPDKFITFFMAILDASTGRIETVNAGHNPLLLLRKEGKTEMIEAGGIGLGMFDMNIPFNSESYILEKGDALFLYTDGIPEAMNPEEDLYSDERMTEFASENRGLHAKDFVQEIIADVQAHSAGAPQSDDITAVFIKRL